MTDIRLFGYFRSSAAYRVRIALALKGLEYRHVGVHLVRNGGEQHWVTYREINPQGLVPTLRDDDFNLTQSLAILEYLEEKYPKVALLPKDLNARARVRQIASTIACDIHPINNLRILNYLSSHLKITDAQRLEWIQRWIVEGFDALERLLKMSPATKFCVGDVPTIADCCLVPQVFNACRFNVDMKSYERICAIVENCEALEAFKAAHPSKQPDVE